AFEIIYRRMSGFVYTVAKGVVNEQQIAEEITQEVFLKIYQNIKNFKLYSSLKTWVYRITLNTSFNTYRKLKRENNHRLAIENYLSDRYSQEDKDAIDRRYLVSYILDKLNPQQRAVIVLREKLGLSYKEIATSLKVNTNVVRSRLRRARQTLLKIVKDMER
ncbi:MAG: sigma-70 family RNA polymerase sigma factor, partial [Candidatus Omnitrophica bacterium]|nr:sigma-70 family RNA polymerase sigma factor [Candidatus Omnitrophota bacterium]